MIGVVGPVWEVSQDVLVVSVSSQALGEPVPVAEEVEGREGEGKVEEHVEGQFLDVGHAVESFFFVVAELRVDDGVGGVPEELEEGVADALR